MIPILDVYDSSSGDVVLVGRARFTLRHGVVSTTFAYDESYLSRPDAYAIEPAFPLNMATQRCMGLPGAFRDSLPDRWGRHLIAREHEAGCMAAGKALHQLDDVDFLVGVFDETREGSLRFCQPGSEFLSQSGPIPPIVELPTLLNASRQVAEDEAGHEQIKELLAAGSGSLGGARPKASVRDGERLLLAKFSHPKDEWNVMAWEKTMLDMARDALIAVPMAKLISIGDENVLLLERFDRIDSKLDGTRVAYMSAMTVLSATDGDLRDYAELAEGLPLLVKDVKAQLASLFRRVVFSVAVHNTDDHLRNWGFLRKGGAWGHAPMFDVNPNPYEGADRSSSIMGESGEREVVGLRDLRAYVQLDTDAAAKVVRDVLSVVCRWPEYAHANGCSSHEMSLFRPIFETKQKALESAF